MIVSSCLYDGDPSHEGILDVIQSILVDGEEHVQSSSIPDLKYYSTQDEVRFIILGPDCCSWENIRAWKNGEPAGTVPIIHYKTDDSLTDTSGLLYSGPTVTVVRNLDDLQIALGIKVTDDEINEAIASITTTIQSREAVGG